MEKNYNPEVLSDLIKSAIGYRTQKWFAKETGITPAHLNRILHGKYPYPPRKSTLKSIAAASEGRVSEQALLDACGYETEDPEEPSPLSADMIRKRMEAAILSGLRNGHDSLSVLQNDETCDLNIQLNGENEPVWKFVFFIPGTASLEDPVFCNLMTRLVYMKNDPECKTSIVTIDENAFKALTDKPAGNLNIGVSFILVDYDNLVVSQEKWISGSEHLKAYMKKLHF